MKWFLRRLFPPRLPRAKAKYVGSVYSTSYVVIDKDTGEKAHFDQWWTLTERGGKRFAESIGDSKNSPFAIERRAQVSAWLSGGPLPPLGRRVETTTPPKPRKTKPAPKAKTQTNVISLADRRSA